VKVIWLFLKWCFGVRGSIGHPWLADQHMQTGKFLISSHECEICGKEYWSRSKKPSPVCMRWSCFRQFYSRPTL